MSAFRVVVVSLPLLGFTLGCGCVSASRQTLPAKRHTYALMVAEPDGARPTAPQWSALTAAFTRAVGPGNELAKNFADADKLIHVVFKPDPADPDGGTATIVAIELNAHPRLNPWEHVIDPENDPRGFELTMAAFRGW